MLEVVSRDEIFMLRWTVLRPTQPLEAVLYPEDETPGIFHLAARDDTGAPISCATFFPDPLDGEPAWRFRGMATVAEHRGRGIGGALLEYGIAEVAARGARLVWCNGRTSATAFYLRHGFATRGEEFQLPPNGPHHVFARRLP